MNISQLEGGAKMNRRERVLHRDMTHPSLIHRIISARLLPSNTVMDLLKEASKNINLYEIKSYVRKAQNGMFQNLPGDSGLPIHPMTPSTGVLPDSESACF